MERAGRDGDADGKATRAGSGERVGNERVSISLGEAGDSLGDHVRDKLMHTALDFMQGADPGARDSNGLGF